MSETGIEQEIQAKGLNAPRVTPADIKACIATEMYFTAAEGTLGASIWGNYHPEFEQGVFEQPKATLDLLTICVLILQNGFTVIGFSACASPENFDAEIGRNIARENAVRQIWPLLGYELRTKLSNQ
jgi:hypothetical protein